MIADIVTAAFTTISTIVSIIALVKSVQNSKDTDQLTKEQNRISMGELEIQVRNSIYEVTRELAYWSEKASQDSNNPIVQQAFNMIDEQYRNAYEEACAKYLDNKVDKTRFKKMYQNEIRQLVENDAEKDHYSFIQSPYSSTIAVYQEWFRQS